MTTDDRHLRFAAIIYAAGLLLHTADHLRRGLDTVTPWVLWAGNVSTGIGIIGVALVLTRHRLAPVVAAVTGLPIAIGVAAVHLLPHWSELSDPFPGAHGTGVTALSWSVVLVEIVGALALGVAGAIELRHEVPRARERAG